MSFTIVETKAVLQTCAAALSDSKEELERIDRLTGDGDLGISMQKVGAALSTVTDSYAGDNIGQLLSRCAMAVNSAAPSTMGTLLCAALMQLGKSFAGKQSLEIADIAGIPEICASAIQSRGRACEGDRTVLDALLPMSRAFAAELSAGGGLESALAAGSAAAEAGAERTKDLVPRVGRAKWMPENAAGVPDGGAVLCCMLLRALTGKAS